MSFVFLLIVAIKFLFLITKIKLLAYNIKIKIESLESKDTSRDPFV